MKKIIIVVAIILIALVVYFGFIKKDSNSNPNGPVVPELVDVKSQKGEIIRIDSPKPDATISGTSDVAVYGDAKGFWFFEASFPVEVQDADGKVVGKGIAQAQDDWMTENYVPFVAVIKLDSSVSGKGKIVLRKDNPSGLPENEDLVEIPVKFE